MKIKILLVLFFIARILFPGRLPVYSDYLSDNYLIHPSMAGAANCAG
jgi:hypothetical protein